MSPKIADGIIETALQHSITRGDFDRLVLDQTPNVEVTEHVAIAAANNLAEGLNAISTLSIYDTLARYQRRHVSCRSEYT